MIFTATLLALSLTSVLAAPAPRDSGNYTGPSNAICSRQTYTISLPTYATVPFSDDISPNPNQTMVTSRFQRFFTSQTNFTMTYSNGTNSTAGSHQLSGVLCVPTAGDQHFGTIQLLVHGVGFDSSYWDFSYMPDTYSYVQAAAAAGYSTFRYDRLGTGESEYPSDGYRTVQAATDLAILSQFVSLLRSASINGVTYTTIVGVGHSYGSEQLAALSAEYPDAVDALVLTGFSANSSSTPLFLGSAGYTLASTVFPSRFSSLPGAYLTTGLPQFNQFDFFYYPYYDQAAFAVVRETEAPVTQGVLFTQGELVGPSPYFTGPVHVVSGDRDLPFCGDQCNIIPPPGNMTILELVGPSVFPASRNFSVYSPQHTGHALNMHYSAPQTYNEIMGWIDGMDL